MPCNQIGATTINEPFIDRSERSMTAVRIHNPADERPSAVSDIVAV